MRGAQSRKKHIVAEGVCHGQVVPSHPSSVSEDARVDSEFSAVWLPSLGFAAKPWNAVSRSTLVCQSTRSPERIPCRLQVTEHTSAAQAHKAAAESTAKAIIPQPSRNLQRHKAAAAKPRSRPRTLTQRAPCRPRSNISGRAARVTPSLPPLGEFSRLRACRAEPRSARSPTQSPSPPPPCSRA